MDDGLMTGSTDLDWRNGVQ